MTTTVTQAYQYATNAKRSLLADTAAEQSSEEGQWWHTFSPSVSGYSFAMVDDQSGAFANATRQLFGRVRHGGVLVSNSATGGVYGAVKSLGEVTVTHGAIEVLRTALQGILATGTNLATEITELNHLDARTIAFGANHYFANQPGRLALTNMVGHFLPVLASAPAFARIGLDQPILEALAYDPLITEDLMAEAGLAVVETEAPSVFQLLDNRIRELKAIAADEGTPLSTDSLTMAAEFLGGVIQFSSVPNLFLLESGNFRAAWRGGGEQIALEFLPTGSIRYVFFARRDGSIARTIGVDDFQHTAILIASLGLAGLLSHEG